MTFAVRVGDLAERLPLTGPADVLVTARSDLSMSGDISGGATATVLRAADDTGAVCRAWTAHGFGEAALPWRGMATVVAGHRMAESFARHRDPDRPAPPGDRPAPPTASDRLVVGAAGERAGTLREAWRDVSETIAGLLGDRVREITLGSRTLDRAYADTTGTATAERVELTWCTVTAVVHGAVLARSWLGGTIAELQAALRGNLPQPLADLSSPAPTSDGCVLSPWATAQLLRLLAIQQAHGAVEPSTRGAVGIIDHPSWGAAARSFDDEGVATRPAVLMGNGPHLHGLVDLRTATRTGARPLGHATRPRWDDPVEVQTRCLEFTELPSSTPEGPPLRVLELRGKSVGHDTETGSVRLTAMVAREDGRVSPTAITARTDTILASIGHHPATGPVTVPLPKGVARCAELSADVTVWN